MQEYFDFFVQKFVFLNGWVLFKVNFQKKRKIKHKEYIGKRNKKGKHKNKGKG